MQVSAQTVTVSADGEKVTNKNIFCTAERVVITFGKDNSMTVTPIYNGTTPEDAVQTFDITNNPMSLDMSEDKVELVHVTKQNADDEYGITTHVSSHALNVDEAAEPANGGELKAFVATGNNTKAIKLREQDQINAGDAFVLRA